MNNKGFTLIELLAVLIIMITILLIAIPSISSSLERNKDNLDVQKEKTIKTAAEVYVDTYLSKSKESLFKTGSCGVYIRTLIENNLIDEETTVKNNNENVKEKCVKYINNDYEIISCSESERC